MTIIYHEEIDLNEKGEVDSQRHRDKIDKSIREGIRNVIGNESIITKKGKRKVKVTVKGLKDYSFVYGTNKNSAGVGQGEGNVGDIINRKIKDGIGGPGGEGQGDGILDTEIDIDYLLQIMFKDLGLPWIEEKTKTSKLIPTGWKFKSISKKGIYPRMNKKKTIIESVKRTMAYVGEIMRLTGCNNKDANLSLIQSKGNINEAIKIIKENRLIKNDSQRIFIEDDDLRFKQIEENVEPESNAVIFAMMDTSGSMSSVKKYLCRSLLFWMVEFLRKKYKNVKIIFIQHTTKAKRVNENEFFHKASSGGTNCYTAFEKVNYIIDTEFPVKDWNIYSVYMGDGDDFDSAKTIKQIQEMLDKKINMLSYIEINDDFSDNNFINNSNYTTLIDKIKNNWKFESKEKHGNTFYKNKKDHFLLSTIKDKSHIWPTLKHMLFEKDK